MASPAPLPSRIGPYPIRGLIGAGAMGQVYLGHDPGIDRPVAVKVIHHGAGEDASLRAQAAARFCVEAQAAGRLNHPGIVSIYQFGEDQGRSYIAMEYVAGRSLREHLGRGPRFTPIEVLCVMSQLLDALQFAHDHGVVHRDVKPANLIVARDGRLKITDFGIARMESSPVTRDITRTHVVIGSPGYMAPEQYSGGGIDGRTDVFAAGVLLYQLLCGKAPFGGSEEAVMYQIVYGETPRLPPDLLDDAARNGFDAVLARALAKLPADRYVSAAALRQALFALANGPVPDALQRTLAEPPEPVGPPGSGASRPSRPSLPIGPFATPTVPPTGWNDATLVGLERELASHLGPMARVLVRRAARGHTSLDAVRQDVAAAIQDPAARERFLRAGRPVSAGGAATGNGAGSASAAPGASLLAQAPGTAPPHTLVGTALGPEDVERVGAALTRTLGPITKVLVRRCAAEARTREQLVASLLEQLGPGVDLPAVEASLWQALR
jgi:serine/threonine-protein kinase